MIQGLQYCTRCIMPETQEGITFDEMGICMACQSSEQKMHINWQQRRGQLSDILAEAKSKAGDNYDCIIPISGGKDSFFQLHVLCREFGLKPLAVTFSHNWFSKTGYYNLQLALETFNIDHIQFTPNRSLVNKLAKKSIYKIGDACWHCHSGVGAFPLQVAVRYGVPLLVWGESIAEASGRASYEAPVRKFDREYFEKVSAKVPPAAMLGDGITEQDLNPFKLPTAEQCEAIGLQGIHLGDYIFWDDEKQMEFVRDHYGWKETEMEGTYKCYKSAECIMPGVHDFACYLKRGYGRASYQASLDVRNGLLTRNEGKLMAGLYDPERPHALDYFLEITGMSEDEFYKAVDAHRHAKLTERPPIVQKTRNHAECLVPYAQQILTD
jgi:N-acetyl sugar amidotransferase